MSDGTEDENYIERGLNINELQFGNSLGTTAPDDTKSVFGNVIYDADTTNQTDELIKTIKYLIQHDGPATTTPAQPKIGFGPLEPQTKKNSESGMPGDFGRPVTPTSGPTTVIINQITVILG